MAETTPHKGLTGLDIHTIVRWVVADAASLPTTVTAADLHKVAYTQDTKTYYGLVSAAPVEWRALGSSANPVVGMEVVESDLVVTFEDESTETIALPSGGGGGVAPVEIMAAPMLTPHDVGDLSYINTKTVVSDAGLHHMPWGTLRPSHMLAAVMLPEGPTVPNTATFRIKSVFIQVASQDGDPSSLASNYYPIPPLEDEMDAWRTEWFEFPLKDLIFRTPSESEVQAGMLPKPLGLPSVVYDEAGGYIEIAPTVTEGMVPPISLQVIIPCRLPDVYIVSARLHLEFVGYTPTQVANQGLTVVTSSSSIAGYAIDHAVPSMEPYLAGNPTFAAEVDPNKPDEIVIALLFPDQQKFAS